MNLGLKDALALADALTEALRSGSGAALDRYAAERRPIARTVVRFASQLTRLATVPAPVRPLRNGLLSALARVPAFRRRLAYRLSGLDARVRPAGGLPAGEESPDGTDRTEPRARPASRSRTS